MAVASYIKLARLNKPIGIFLLLWPTLMALYIAGDGHPPLPIVIIFVLGAIFMRSAGCILNDWTDQNFDKYVSRTKDRPLAKGTVSSKEAAILFGGFLLLAFLAVLFLNVQTLYLSFIALGLTLVYPWMKRYTHWPQMILGMAFGMGILMSFTAIQEMIPLCGWLLYGAGIVWALIFDTEYAMADRADDIKLGLKSTAILFGKHDRLIIGLLQILFIVLLYSFGKSVSFNRYYFVSLAVISLYFLYQQYLMRDRTPSLCTKAFLNNHYVGLALFLWVLLEYGLKQ